MFRLATIIFLSVAMTALTCAPVAGLILVGSGTPFSTFTSFGTAPLQANITYAAPMAIRNVGGGYAIGTDENDCTMKDATGFNVKAAPTANFVEFKFHAPALSAYAFQADAYAPDSLANSFWLQVDNGKGLECSVTTSVTLKRNTLSPVSPITTAYAEMCWTLNVGTHTARLYSREPGAAVSLFRVLPVASLRINATIGCTACRRSGGDLIRITLANFCGPSMFHPDLIHINGERCATLTLMSQDTVGCVTPTLSSLGARNTMTIDVLSKNASTNATTIVATQELGLEAAYVDENSNSSTTLVAALVTVAGVVVLACVAIVIVRFTAAKGARDVANAPKSGEVTIIFTDVEQSTELWSKYTTSMATALDVHHAVIREAIARHGGYEVKTVGDSFMIATKNATAALAIARDIQVELLRRPAPRCITGHYLGSELEDAPEQLDEPAEGAVFHGLRVRIGMHTGVPEVVFDEVSKGYDYYGSDVNLAARIESVASGGQILVSNSVAAHVMAELKVALGPSTKVQLRGFAEAVEVVHLVVLELPAERQQYTFKDMADQSSTNHFVSSSGHSTRSSFHRNQTHLDQQLDDLSRKLAGDDADAPTTSIRMHVEDRLALLDIMLRPLNPDQRAACLSALFSGWRSGSAPAKTLLRGARIPSDALFPLLARIVTTEHKKIPTHRSSAPITPVHAATKYRTNSMHAASIDGLPHSISQEFTN
jgi:class 3 adenylate cyclase